MLIKQPNGKFCYIGRGGGVLINLTAEDYKEIRINEAVQAVEEELAAEKVGSIADLIQHTMLSDDTLKSMGCEMTHDEMMKYIPQNVVDTSYASRDYTTHGKCPNCGEHVQDGIGHKDEKCQTCGQCLNWNQY